MGLTSEQTLSITHIIVVKHTHTHNHNFISFCVWKMDLPDCLEVSRLNSWQALPFGETFHSWMYGWMYVLWIHLKYLLSGFKQTLFKPNTFAGLPNELQKLNLSPAKQPVIANLTYAPGSYNSKTFSYLRPAKLVPIPILNWLSTTQPNGSNGLALLPSAGRLKHVFTAPIRELAFTRVVRNTLHWTQCIPYCIFRARP